MHLARFGTPVLALSIVTPGPDKDDQIARTAQHEGRAAVLNALAAHGWPVLDELTVDASTGPESLWAVDADAHALKHAMIAVEDHHALGRLFDLDVLTQDSVGPRPVSRLDLGRPPRACLVCGHPAAACGRSAAHPLPVVLAARAALAAGRPLDARAHRLADLAVNTLDAEARLTPKPGLVDAENSGAHGDMDLALLHTSAEALRPWFLGCVALGRAGSDVSQLADLGRHAEAAMLRATGGVNTHRGALFTLGLMLAALGRLPDSPRPSMASLLNETGRLSVQLSTSPSDERRRGRPTSAGERAWAEHGIGGIRAEARAGYPTIRRVGLPALRSRLGRFDDPADALRWTLVSLMATVSDTCLVARGGLDALTSVQRWAAGVRGRSPGPLALVNELRDADAWFTARRWSPGGSADLLAATLFAHEAFVGD